RDRAGAGAFRFRVSDLRGAMDVQTSDSGGFFPDDGGRERDRFGLVLARMVFLDGPGGCIGGVGRGVAARYAESGGGKTEGKGAGGEAGNFGGNPEPGFGAAGGGVSGVEGF